MLQKPVASCVSIKYLNPQILISYIGWPLINANMNISTKDEAQIHFYRFGFKNNLNTFDIKGCLSKHFTAVHQTVRE